MDEVYCVDFVADKIVSGGKDKTVKMCVTILLSPYAWMVNSSILSPWVVHPHGHLTIVGRISISTTCSSCMTISYTYPYQNLGTLDSEFSCLRVSLSDCRS